MRIRRKSPAAVGHRDFTRRRAAAYSPAMTSQRSSPARRRAVGPVAGAAAPDYQALVEAAGDLIYTLDLEGRFTFVNPAARQVLGYNPTEVIGRSFTEVLTPESAKVALKHFRQGLAQNESTPFFEVEAKRKQGGTVHLEIRAGGLYRDGSMIGRQGVGRDISELRALQAEVAAKSERVSLLEERTRIAMNLYARIADLAGGVTGDPAQSRHALREVHDAVLRVSAEKLGLTAADLKILELLARGLSNPEIAVELHRSPHTIKDHIARIMQRLGTHRRAEAVATAINLGLVAPPP